MIDKSISNGILAGPIAIHFSYGEDINLIKYEAKYIRYIVQQFFTVAKFSTFTFQINILGSFKS